MFNKIILNLKKKESLKYLKFYRYLLPFWKKEVMALFLNGITMVLGLANPYLTKLIIDKAYGNRNLRLFIILIAIGGVIFVLNGIISAISGFLNRHIALRINFDLNCKVFRKLQSLPYGFFQDSSTGEHLYKINYDINQVTALVVDMLPQFVSVIPKLLLTLIIVFCLNFKIALLVLVLTPFFYITPYYFTRKLKQAFKKGIENMQNIFKNLQEVLSHIHLVKALGKEKYEIKQYAKGLINNIRFGLVNTRLEAVATFTNSLVNRIILGLIVFYGGYQIIKGKMTLGSLSAIILYLNQLAGLQSSLAGLFPQVALGFISCERLTAILDAQPVIIEDKDAKETIFSKGQIEFRDVTFGYREDKMVLESLSFCIKGGSRIALVGPSGCGKTTIVGLILRLYRPLSGQINIDGSKINLIKSKSLYQQIGVVLQEPWLWNDTVINNIRYGRPDASFKEAAEAARVACIDDSINSLPGGYDTVIGENACKISEGQKQRIAITRAVVKCPKILILDEALSSVDAQVESRIIDNIRNLLPDSSIVVISHRLSTIKKMDLVYFLVSPGKIDISTHEELSKSSLQYQDYLAHQLKEEKTALNLF